MASLALDTELTQEQREHLETVSQSADCLLHIVNAILDLAKIEAGRLELEHVPFSISDTIGSTMKMLQVCCYHSFSASFTYFLRQPFFPNNIYFDKSFRTNRLW